MRFIVDANLPPHLVAWLREQGGEAEHSNDLLGVGATDTDILDAANVDGGVIVSKDRDFRRLVTDDPPPQLLWVRIGNATNAKLIALFERRFEAALAELKAGELHVELRD
ncbi:MAG: DUF5615 family PIN-like protein [Pseudomonadota bacterium]